MSVADDYVSAPFLIEQLELYKDGDNADKFFRPALRSLLVNYHLMTLINVERLQSSEENPFSMA